MRRKIPPFSLPALHRRIPASRKDSRTEPFWKGGARPGADKDVSGGQPRGAASIPPGQLSGVPGPSSSRFLTAFEPPVSLFCSTVGPAACAEDGAIVCDQSRQ